jgi:uncharacterized protein with von Willebrand factor type A (vWA) domain
VAVLERHIEFVEALRKAGFPVSVAEDLDSAVALTRLPWHDRETVKAAYAATLVKRQSLRPTFDALFDLWFPRLVGTGVAAAEEAAEAEGGHQVRDAASDLQEFRERLLDALTLDDQQALQDLAVDAIGRFGAMPGRGPGLSAWSAYTAMQRVDPDSLIGQLMVALGAETPGQVARAQRRIGDFRRAAEADARRRVAEEKGAESVARTTIRPTIEQLDFMAARREDLEEMRRQIQPLARRLATRLTKEHHARRGRALDFRRTVRASISTGGVPITTHHKPKRPHRSELVVLCDVSGSVANFAQFTLLLVFALRDQFTKVRAFTFVDTVHEVTDQFVPGADVSEVMAGLAASVQHAALWGRTNYGRAFTVFNREYADALGPRTSLLILGDARSNYSDLNEGELKRMVDASRHAWWLNPEHTRNWATGDSAAMTYGELVPMVECRNLTQLGEFVHDIV